MSKDKYIKRKNKKIDALRIKKTTFTKDELAFLYSLSKSKNYELRIIAAELLVDHYTTASEDILYHMTFDKEYLVRLNAVDSLCIGRTQKSVERLYFMTQDKDYLIRGYAIMSYVDVIKNIQGIISKTIIKQLCDKLNVEENEWVKVIIYRTLYIAGENDYLMKVITSFHRAVNENDFEVMWCILSVFDEIINESNYEHIRKALKERYDDVLNAQRDKIDEILNL